MPYTFNLHCQSFTFTVPVMILVYILYNILEDDTTAADDNTDLNLVCHHDHGAGPQGVSVLG